MLKELSLLRSKTVLYAAPKTHPHLIQDLQKRLQERESDAQVAASIGQMLLAQIDELKERLKHVASDDSAFDMPNNCTHQTRSVEPSSSPLPQLIQPPPTHPPPFSVLRLSSDSATTPSIKSAIATPATLDPAPYCAQIMELEMENARLQEMLSAVEQQVQRLRQSLHAHWNQEGFFMSEGIHALDMLVEKVWDLEMLNQALTDGNKQLHDTTGKLTCTLHALQSQLSLERKLSEGKRVEELGMQREIHHLKSILRRFHDSLREKEANTVTLTYSPLIISNPLTTTPLVIPASRHFRKIMKIPQQSRQFLCRTRRLKNAKRWKSCCLQQMSEFSNWKI